jgi:hypothetical protein
MLYAYSTHTVLILYAYCYSYCTHTLRILYPYSTHTLPTPPTHTVPHTTHSAGSEFFVVELEYGTLRGVRYNTHCTPFPGAQAGVRGHLLLSTLHHTNTCATPYCTHTVLMLYSTHTLLILCSYCTHTLPTRQVELAKARGDDLDAYLPKVARGGDSFTLLIYAAGNGNVDAVQALLAADVGVNVASRKRGQWSTHALRILYPYSTHTLLILYPYPTHTLHRPDGGISCRAERAVGIDPVPRRGGSGRESS